MPLSQLFLPSSAKAQAKAQLGVEWHYFCFSQPANHPATHPPAGIVDLQLQLSKYTYNCA